MQRRRAKVGYRCFFHAGFARCGLALLLALAVAPASGATPVAAAPADSRQRLDLDIAAQDLADALELFSRSTGMAVLVDRELTRGRRSVRVQGRYSARDALSRLLTGSGLMARYARSDAFTLQVAQLSDPPTASSAGGSAGAWAGSSFASALQRAVEAGLCRSELTRPGRYRAVLQLWIDRGGHIEHSRLLTTTGDLQRDEALVQRLAETWVERPAPSSLRQPVTLLLLPDSTGKPMDCRQREGASGA
ncbi:STN domain-containing protein [Pseudomonas sp. MRSN 12121]|uniref:Secretin/TonB domain-containing protein n=1 Tax=Pseudomonas chlororaphis TaxID=587753 RepID=A0A0D5Y0A7_9PSED|nr:STN domain-containing protein [Pseudomonas sp. MRSN 12121]AKA24758.1 secretin/TonB domain-containing protein [Pseudomonas chlororaphis]